MTEKEMIIKILYNCGFTYDQIDAIEALIDYKIEQSNIPIPEPRTIKRV